MNYALMIIRTATLIEERFINLMEAEQYTSDINVFHAWVNQMWSIRAAQYRGKFASDIKDQDINWKETRPKVIALLSRFSSIAAQLAAVTPEQEREAWKAIGVTNIPQAINTKNRIK